MPTYVPSASVNTSSKRSEVVHVKSKSSRGIAQTCPSSSFAGFSLGVAGIGPAGRETIEIARCCWRRYSISIWVAIEPIAVPDSLILFRLGALRRLEICWRVRGCPDIDIECNGSEFKFEWNETCEGLSIDVKYYV